MTSKQTSMPQARIAARRQQQEALRAKETQLQTLASQHNKEEFFRQITPFLRPLKSYIKRRLRVAYLTLDVRTPVYTSGDILDSVVLKAYENYDKKPPELTLEQWLYQLANEIVDGYVRQRKVTDARRRGRTLFARGSRRLRISPGRFLAGPAADKLPAGSGAGTRESGRNLPNCRYSLSHARARSNCV